ncbi:MAG: HAMP domain-containing protein [Pseudonocardiaceae bacterium]|nr:HAMP domain-containing protein [Pseudonocardiaceae bacterium]
MRILGARSLRARITLLATGLAAAVSAILLVLAWMLAGNVGSAVPQLPDGSLVRVQGIDVESSELAGVLRQQAQQRVLLAGSVAFTCVVAAAAILAWTFTGRVLRPLREVTTTAHRLSAESLDKRIGPTGSRDELADLAGTFDAMLDRLEEAFSAQRRFVANASHELRTPLSVIRAELDVTLSDDDADVAELRRMADVVRSATERAERLVDALLLLARTQGAGLASRDPVDLASVAETAWAQVRGEAEGRGLSVRLQTLPAAAAGEPALLERVAGNLVENAVRHNVDGGWVEICTSAGPRFSELTVRSSGAEVSAERAHELVEPFRRGGTARTAQSGTGLGLSIVRAIVTAHAGKLRVLPIDGGGLAVTVHLPAAP